MNHRLDYWGENYFQNNVYARCLAILNIVGLPSVAVILVWYPLIDFDYVDSKIFLIKIQQ